MTTRAKTKKIFLFPQVKHKEKEKTKNQSPPQSKRPVLLNSTANT